MHYAHLPEPFYPPLPLDRYRAVVIVAPHPDDETLGCGGLIIACGHAGRPVTVHLLTDGAAQGDPTLRQQEAQAAASHLGVTFTHHRLPDRTLTLTPELVHQLTGLLLPPKAEAYPLLIATPHPDEPHPDHQAAALLLWQIVQRHNTAHPDRPIDLVWYEVGAPLPHPTHLQPLQSSWWERKKEAMAQYRSQNDAWRYHQRIEALNTYRALPCGPTVPAAEAYTHLPLAEKGIAAALPHLDWLWRLSRNTAATPDDLPLVSILIRTTGDPRLRDAVASALAQTYPHREICIVLAHGGPLPAPLTPLADHPAIRILSPAAPLQRAAAANQLLAEARGQWLLFLDEDDLIEPTHLETLLTTLRSHPHALAAATQTRVEDAASGKYLATYAYDETPERLYLANLYPIHAVLFHRRLVTEHGCRFDETLPRLEDWDFWLQIARHTPIIPTRRCTACYRYQDRSGLHDERQRATNEQLAERILTRHWAHLIAANRHNPILRALARHAHEQDNTIAQLHLRNAENEQQLAQLHQALATAHQENQRLTQQLNHLAAAWQADLAAVHRSLSWRLTAPLRHLKRLISL